MIVTASVTSLKPIAARWRVPNSLEINVLDQVTNAEDKSVGEVVTWYEQQGLAFINQDEQFELTVNNQPLSISQLFYTDDYVK